MRPVGLRDVGDGVSAAVQWGLEPGVVGLTSWNNMVGVIPGRQVIPWTPPTRTRRVGIELGPLDVGIDRDLHPYTDPAFPGAPAVDVP